VLFFWPQLCLVYLTSHPPIPHPTSPTIVWQLCERLQELHERQVVPVADLVRLRTGQHADQRRKDVPDYVARIVVLARQVQHYFNYLQRKPKTPQTGGSN